MINTQEHLSCLICLGIAQEAVHCSFCFALLCNDCQKPISPKICPSCRKSLKCQQSMLARKIINTLDVDCEICQETQTYGTLKDHFTICPKRVIFCNVGVCNYYGLKKDFITHLTKEHCDFVLIRFDKIQTPSNDRMQGIFGPLFDE